MGLAVRSSLVDAAGVAHAAASGPLRIASLVPSITELLFALNLGEHLIARTTFCIHPRAQIDSVVRVGGTKTVRLERLRALEPTHVIVNIDENTRETAEAIQCFAPHLIVTHPLGPEDNLSLYRLLGGVFARQAEAESLCRRFERAYQRTSDASRAWPSRRVLYLIWRDPWMTVSADTYIARTLAVVNWQIVETGSGERYPQLDLTRDALRGVDTVLLSSEPFPFKEKHIREIKALCEPGTEVQLIDGEMTSWYGNRAIRGLDYLHSLAATSAEGAGLGAA